MKPGDVVRLKSGGPKMTVATVYADHDVVEATWFYEQYGKYGLTETRSFRTEQLDPVGPEWWQFREKRSDG